MTLFQAAGQQAQDPQAALDVFNAVMGDGAVADIYADGLTRSIFAVQPSADVTDAALIEHFLTLPVEVRLPLSTFLRTYEHSLQSAIRHLESLIEVIRYRRDLLDTCEYALCPGQYGSP